jgi:hypothetical protein
MKLNKPKRDYENLSNENFTDCLRGLYLFCAELQHYRDTEFENIVNKRFLKLFQFSYDNDVYFEYCSFKTYNKLFEERYIGYKTKLIDTEKKDFAKIELDKILDQYEHFTNKPFWQNNIIEIHNNSKIKKIEFLNELLINKIPNENPKHEKIFANNGFILFEYLLNEHIRPKGITGRFADISDYYWKMCDSETQYIHQRPERFKEWFSETYDNEYIGKIKTADNLKNIDRDKHYSNSLDWFKTQNQ